MLKELIARYPYQLKFVIETSDDIIEVRRMIEEIGADPERVLLMPEGTQLDILMDRSRWLVEVVQELSFSLLSKASHHDLGRPARGMNGLARGINGPT